MALGPNGLEILGDGTEEWQFDPRDELVITAEQASRDLLGSDTVNDMLAKAGPEPE